jgi:hypothetical protein
MNRFAIATVALFCLSPLAIASPIWNDAKLFVDSYPNTVADFTPWFDDTLAYYSTGGSQNFRNGSFPNTTTFAATDAIYHSATPAGRGLVFILVAPNATAANLTANDARIQAKSTFLWAGSPAVLDWDDNLVSDITDTTGGVIAFLWDGIDLAIQPSNPTYDQMAQDMNNYLTTWTAEFRQLDPAGSPIPASHLSLTTTLVVPEPATLSLLSLTALCLLPRRRS